MLNEYLEFEAYVTVPQSNKPRIQPYYFTNSYADTCELNGLEEVLTVVARGFIDMYKEGCSVDYGIDEKLVYSTCYVLCKWCGFNGAEKNENVDEGLVGKWFQEYPDADGWLKSYWKYHFNKAYKSRKTELTGDILWEKVAEKWEKSLITSEDYRAKRITYKNVVVNALENGPLRNRYLVLKKGEAQAKKGKIDFKYVYNVKEGESNPNKNTEQKFLKNIATYLILKEKHPMGQREVLLRKGSLLGWYGQDDAKGDATIWYLTRFVWNDVSIFSRNNKCVDSIKFIVNSEYIDYFSYKLIEQEDIGQYKDMYWVLKDCGHGQYMEVIN